MVSREESDKEKGDREPKKAPMGSSEDVSTCVGPGGSGFTLDVPTVSGRPVVVVSMATSVTSLRSRSETRAGSSLMVRLVVVLVFSAKVSLFIK